MLPNETLFSGSYIYDSNSQVAEIWISRPVSPTNPLYAGVQSVVQSVTRNYAAKVDIVARSPGDDAGYLLRVPQVGSEISFQKDLDAQTATLFFQPTGNARDIYSYWRYNLTWDFDTDRFVSATACGIREFMEPAYPSSVTTLTDGRIQAIFHVDFNEEGFEVNYLGVIASRDCTDLGIDCYEATYYLVHVSPASLLAPTLSILLLVFACILSFVLA